MSPRPDVSELRKSQILNAAEEVLAQKGIDDARMDDIASETGLSKGTLYLYFKNKGDLVSAILDRIFERQLSEMETLGEDAASARQQLEKFAELTVKDISAMLRLMPVAYEFLALAFRNTAVQRALKAYMKRYMNILVPLVQRGIDSGEFRRVDAREVAVALGAVVEGTILLWVYDKSLVDTPHNIQAGIGFVLDGIQSSATA
jgi:AcrR family transcriptional regulator